MEVTRQDSRINMKFARRFWAIFDIILNVMIFVAGVLLLLVVLLVSANVVLRYIFHRPLGCAIEISLYMLVFIAFLVIAWVLREEGHVKIDIVTLMFKESTRDLVNTITSALNTAISIIITLSAIKVTWDLYQSDYFTPTILMTPKWIFIAVIAFGFFMLSIQFMRRTSGYLKSWRSQHHLSKEG